MNPFHLIQALTAGVLFQGLVHAYSRAVETGSGITGSRLKGEPIRVNVRMFPLYTRKGQRKSINSPDRKK